MTIEISHTDRLASRVPAPLLLLTAMALLSAGSGFAKVYLTSENVFAFGFVRIALGAAMLMVIARPNLANIDRGQWRDMIILGVVIAAFKIVDLFALVSMPLGLMVTIGFLGPLTVSVLHAKSKLDYVWPLLGFGGVALLAPLDSQSSLTWTAVGFGLLSAVAWGSYIIISSRVGQSMRGLEGFTIANLVATIVLLPFGISGAGQFITDPNLLAVMVGITALAIFPLGLEFLALKRLPKQVFGVLLSLEPAIASVLGLVILGELLGAVDWLAVAIVSVASIGATLTARAADKRQAA